MRKRGRHKPSKLTRDEQLRRAKRRQRPRQRAAGIVHVQLAVPGALAEKMAVARRADLLTQAFDEALDRRVPVLSIDDAVAEKFRGNTDLGLDNSTLGRDLIDLVFCRG